MFLHAGWLHLLANMLYLALFGPPVERRLGTPRFVVLFFLSGLIGGATYLVAQPSSQTPAIGASAAIGGVLAAHLVLYPRSTLGSLAPVLFLPVFEDAPTMLLVVVWLATQLFSSVASLTATTGLAWWAHLGGFASGLALAAVLRRTPRRLAR
jgi:membrane associated rhomboid family serine protease